MFFSFANRADATIENEEKFAGKGGGAFISINKGLGFRETKGAGGSELAEENDFTSVVRKSCGVEHVDDFLNDPFNFSESDCSASFLRKLRFPHMMRFAMAIW